MNEDKEAVEREQEQEQERKRKKNSKEKNGKFHENRPLERRLMLETCLLEF
jgi:hypothetical protein